MEESDLLRLWEGEERLASSYYKQIGPEVEAIALKRSNNSIERVLRNCRNEAWLTVLFSLGMTYYFTLGIAVTIIMGSAIVVANYYAFQSYQKLKKEVYAINQNSVVDALVQYIDILNRYIQRLNFHAYFSIPIAFIAGLVAAIIYQDFNLSTQEIGKLIGWICLGSLPFLILIIWLLKARYIPLLYGKHLKELQATLEDLINGEREE